MKSQKNSTTKTCIKCNTILDQDNWLKYLQNRSNYICTPCFREYGKYHHTTDPKYNDKQLFRMRSRKSAVIFAYGNKCNNCYEDDYDKLTINVLTTYPPHIGNLYDWLYNNHLHKDDYQVLCYNCQCSKKIDYKDKYFVKNKTKVINHYGGCCTICKEYNIERLVICNTNENKSYTHIYRVLIKQKYPTDMGYYVSCVNCYKSNTKKKILDLNGC